MKLNPFGRTGLHVSPLCLELPPAPASREKSFALLDSFHHAGGNLIQLTLSTPDAGATMDDSARAESHLREWWRHRFIPRRDLFLSLRLELQPASGNGRSASEQIRAAYEATLRRLQTEHLDMLFLEWTDALLPIEETFAVVAQLIRDGHLRYGAVAGFANWRIADLIARSRRNGIARPEAMQVVFPFLERQRADEESLEVAREYRLALFARAPRTGSRLSRPPPLTLFPGYTHTGRVLDGVYRCARERGISPTRMVYAGVLSDAAVTSMVLRPRSVAHLLDAVAATRLTLTPDEVRLLQGHTLPRTRSARAASNGQLHSSHTPVTHPFVVSASDSVAFASPLHSS